MQPADTHPTADMDTSDSSPLSTPSPRASTAPSVHGVGFPECNYVNGREPRSDVWHHFFKAADHTISKKATCMHCGKMFTSRHGSTSTMRDHLRNKHPKEFSETAGADSPNR